MPLAEGGDLVACIVAEDVADQSESFDLAEEQNVDVRARHRRQILMRLAHRTPTPRTRESRDNTRQCGILLHGFVAHRRPSWCDIQLIAAIAASRYAGDGSRRTS